MKRIVSLLLLLMINTACQEEQPLRQAIGDSAPGERWIYDDWARAQKVAQESGKPLLVVFRCVP